MESRMCGGYEQWEFSVKRVLLLLAQESAKGKKGQA